MVTSTEIYAILINFLGNNKVDDNFFFFFLQ